MTIPRIIAGLAGLCAGSALLIAFALADETSDTKEAPADSKSDFRETTIQTLRPLAAMIGEWKGVGQPKRGSSAGAWSEKAVAAWRFEAETADLVMTFEPGQQFHSSSFSLAEDHKTPLLTLVPLKGDPVQLSRPAAAVAENVQNDVWVFESAADRQPQTRCTVRIMSEIRLTLLFEEKTSEKSSYRRLSEIGLTRAGARLASGNTGERECIVTGGLGTIKVAHEGKTFYVCCEGCKQAFEADPAGTIEAWRERQKKAKDAK